MTNVTADWPEMAGESDDLKKLNSLLTSHFVGNRDIPSDECLTHALVVQGFFLSGKDDWQVRTLEYLKAMFAEGASIRTGEKVILLMRATSCISALLRIENLLGGGQWPDRLLVI